MGITAWIAFAYGECVLRVSLEREARESARADVAVVLGAAVWGRTRPSPVLERRARTAARLYHQGRVRAIATTGGVGRGHGETPISEGEAAARFLRREERVAERDIVAETQSRNTVENIRYLAPLLRARGHRSLLIVSDGYHLARALIIARDAGFVAEGVAANGSVRESLARDPARRWSEGQWLFSYAITRPMQR